MLGKVKIILAAILCLLGLVFAIQNQEPVEVMFLMLKMSFSKFTLILLCQILGLVVGLLLGLYLGRRNT